MGAGTGRTTLRVPVSLEGIGLHSGEDVRLRLAPAPPGTGIVFRLQGEGGAEVPVGLDSIADGRNATRLSSRGASVSTVEHLLAALTMASVDDVWVDLDAGEPPACDGSAAPFVRLIERAGLRRHGGVRRLAEIVEQVELRDGDRQISIAPARSLAVEYEIDFDAPAIGRQSLRLDPLDRAAFSREVAGARTFGFLADVDALRAAGRARGADPSNTVVVDGARIVNADGLRWPDEFVRHKVLDLVGDLALFGPPLVGRVRVRRGGHALHHALLRALRETPSAYRIIEG